MSQPEPASTQPPAEPTPQPMPQPAPRPAPRPTPEPAPDLPADHPNDPSRAGKVPPDLQPLEIDLARIVAYGTALFALAFVVMLAFHADLTRAGHRNWPWIALAGTVFGLLGWVLTRRRGGSAER